MVDGVVEGSGVRVRWRELANDGATNGVEGTERASNGRGRIRPVDLTVIENKERDGGRGKETGVERVRDGVWT